VNGILQDKPRDSKTFFMGSFFVQWDWVVLKIQPSELFSAAQIFLKRMGNNLKSN